MLRGMELRGVCPHSGRSSGTFAIVRSVLSSHPFGEFLLAIFGPIKFVCPVHRRTHKGIISELRLRSGHGMTRRDSSRGGFWLECCHGKGRIAIVGVVKSSALACQARRSGIIASSSRFARKSQSIRRRQRSEAIAHAFGVKDKGRQGVCRGWTVRW